MNKKKFVVGWSIAVGLMDVLTGVLLMADPALVLSTLGMAPLSSDALVFLSWVGVFVTGVGLSYAMALTDRRRGRTVWMVTALMRALVAVFVAWRVADGSLVPMWAAVALTDAVVTVVQVGVLRSGWWQEPHR
ncbi:MAG: hypothetical protein NTW21_43800 [Verrucomicrobia bacterium]|nr:hypothetical protein [Verrucomicrobiota bacterium]